MKKIFSLLILLSVTTAFLSAKDFKPELHTGPSVRQQGFGGFYSTDVNNFYGIYANPAMLGLGNPHSLFPSLDLHLAGPLEDIPRIVKSASSEDSQTISDIIKKNDGLRMAMELQPFLSFGHITSFGFGWGLATQPFMKMEVPGITTSDVNVGFETVFTGGYGFSPLNTDNHRLSLGITAKGFFQVAAVMNDGILNVVKTLSDGGLKDVPSYATLGFSFDAGIYYSLCNMLDFALVCHDPWSMCFISENTFGEMFKFKFNKRTKLDPKLSAGVCYHVYTDWTRGKITSFDVMAEYKDFLVFFDKLSRNPILELSLGTEIVFVNIVSLRFGLSEMYPSAGVGFKFGNFNIDFAIYGRELGLEPGSCPCLNSSIFIGFTF